MAQGVRLIRERVTDQGAKNRILRWALLVVQVCIRSYELSEVSRFTLIHRSGDRLMPEQRINYTAAAYNVIYGGATRARNRE